MIYYCYEEISNIRKDFILTGDNLNHADMRRDIVDSWLRSRNSGVNPTARVLPPRQSCEKTSKLVTDYSRYIKNSFSDYYDSKHKLLEELGIAIFYVHESLTIHIRAGNKELTSKLKSANFGFGTTMAESVIGTNAVALAARTGKESWVIGAEHYIEALQEYVCVATPLKGQYDRTSYVMLVAPVKQYTQALYSLFEFILRTETTFTGEQMTLDNYIKNFLINHQAEENNESLIIINSAGKIISANNNFFKTVNKSYLSTIGKPLLSILPELEDALANLAKGKQVTLKEIYLNSLPSENNHFFVSCKSIKNDWENVGAAITMTANKYVQKIIHKVINYTAGFTFNDLLGNNPRFLKIKTLAYKASQSSSNILIIGESGTGKELFAHSIHNASPRSRHPFISVNCAGIPRELIGSELFGYAQGAFTGARKEGAQGKFQLADGGTLFLDEIGEMPLDMQTVLLRVLEDKTVTRLGDSKPIAVDVRLIAATNKDLLDLVNQGKFRLDLYYRLNVVKLDMIPLRERPEDISLLINYFLSYFAASLQKPVHAITDEAMAILQSYSWPGNVRELRNVIERGVNLANSNQIALTDLPTDIIANAPNMNIRHNPQSSQTLISQLDDDYSLREKELIKNLMKKHHSNKSKVAAELGVARTTLYRKLKDL